MSQWRRADPCRAARRGFTLLELLAAVAIIVLLAGLVIGGARRAVETGRVARARTELAALSAALESYRRHHGDYPRVALDSSSGRAVSGEELHAALNGRRGPALGAPALSVRQRVFVPAVLALADPAAPAPAVNRFVDPWGEPYRYGYTPGAVWENSSYVLFSAGPDREATFPFPPDGLRSADYDQALKNGRLVNADNLFANE